jgi:hypothetical protein
MESDDLFDAAAEKYRRRKFIKPKLWPNASARYNSYYGVDAVKNTFDHSQIMLAKSTKKWVYLPSHGGWVLVNL